MSKTGRTVLISALLVVAVVLGVKFGLAPTPAVHTVAEVSPPVNEGGANAPVTRPVENNPAAVQTAPDVSSNGAGPTLVPQIRTVGEFTQMSAEVLRALPQLSKLKGLTEDAVHNIPSIIRDAGAALGQVAQVVNDNPAFEAPAVDFYNECASQSDGVNSIRALCFAHLKQLSAKHGLPLDENKFPPSVRRLAVHILE